MAAGHAILSHGLESGPEATKVTALAAVCEARGWTSERPDYRDLDARGRLGDVGARIERLEARARATTGPLLLAGSSMGAFISGAVAARLAADPSQAARLRGLFLMAPPVALDVWPAPLEAPAGLPLLVVHGWRDELIPASAVVDWCMVRSVELRLLDDAHRLAHHVEACAHAFDDLIARCAA